MKEINIYLIRHAKTSMNKGITFCGSSNVSICKEGISKAKNISKKPVLKDIEDIYITNLIRTKQTADILFGEEKEKKIIPEFAEIDFGDFEGTSITEETINNKIYQDWLYNYKNLTFPNGDNMHYRAKQARRVLEDIVSDTKASNIAIVSHCTLIRILLSEIIMGDIDIFHEIPSDNLGITKLIYKDGKFKIKYINVDFAMFK